MASGDLVQDPQPSLTASAHHVAGTRREWEFAFPLMNQSAGNTAWQEDESYQIAVLVGPGARFTGVAENTWMSDQIMIRVGSRSTRSIYDPPLVGTSPQPEPREPRHGH